MTLDPDFKAKWIAALRSGEYKQTQGRLYREGEGYCCLGVACEITGASVRGSLPTREVRMGWGLTVTSESKLVAMNDCNDKTFSEIADYIEEHL